MYSFFPEAVCNFCSSSIDPVPVTERNRLAAGQLELVDGQPALARQQGELQPRAQALW